MPSMRLSNTLNLRVLDLFSGIGGFSLGLERTGGFETVAFCEIDPFCQKVLRKHWPDVPVYDDVRNLNHDGPIDVICGGYPCQPFSIAGKRGGVADDRHLWPAMFSLIQKHRPTFVIGENVVGHVSMGLDDVLSDLEGEGYSCRTFVIPACATGAPHRRDRVWIVAHSDSHNVQRVQPSSTDTQERQGQNQRQAGSQDAGDGRLWLAEPGVGRVAHGVPGRVDRLRSLGNAVVPQVVEMIGGAILAASAR